jgi:hypothetical protein
MRSWTWPRTPPTTQRPVLLVLSRFTFARQLGSHCNGGNQKLCVDLVVSNNTNTNSTRFVESRYIVGASQADCADLQNGDTSILNISSSSGAEDDGTGGGRVVMGSTCSEPSLQNDERIFYVTCLSGPNTLTPGGVINQAHVLHYPYPKDRRVKAGLRTWEFVADDPTTAPTAAGVRVVHPVSHLPALCPSLGWFHDFGTRQRRRTSKQARRAIPAPVWYHYRR